ncbi:MAG TPA: hypothetical protein VMT08_09345 [Bradyrhizobium sp.]|nr:hypothetical protein [Bradyrhizobium sp.]
MSQLNSYGRPALGSWISTISPAIRAKIKNWLSHPSASAASEAAVLCLADVTNTMGQTSDDFEKGEADGTWEALAVLGKLVSALSRDM